MKEIKAYVRPEVFDDLYAELKSQGYCCMTVIKAEGVGSYIDPYRKEYPDTEIPYMHSKVFKLEIMCRDKDVDDIVSTIEQHAKTGNPGDGIICVLDVKRALSIRTGKEADEVLQHSKH